MPDFDINVNSPARASSGSSLSTSDSEESSGFYRGRVVRMVPNALSMVEEAAEEVGMEAEERMDRRLEERHPRDRHSDAASKKSSSASTATESLFGASPIESGPESVLDEGELEDFFEFLEDHKGSSEEEVLDEARKRFEDVSDQFTALEYSNEHLGDDAQSAGLKKAIGSAIESLMKNSGPSVRAGLNIANEALSLARSGFAPIDEIREFYRKAILDFEGIADLYEKILKRFGKDKFQKALDFLIKATGQDMDSAGPSTSPVHLKSVTDQLYDVEVLGNMHRNFRDLLDRTENLFGQGGNTDAHDLMSEILRLTGERWVSGDHFQRLLAKSGISDVRASIYFLTALREQVRLIPLKIYPSVENRGKMLDAAQEALDIAVNKDA